VVIGRLLRVARPDDWTGTSARLAVALAFVLLVILVPLVPLPAAWVALAGGFPLLVRACMVLVVVVALTVAYALLVTRLPRAVVLWGRKVRFHDGTRRRAVSVYDVVTVHVEQRPPPVHELFVLERRDGVLHDLCPTAWAGAPSLYRAIERSVAAADRRRRRRASRRAARARRVPKQASS
jgi:hypothetical protein